MILNTIVDQCTQWKVPSLTSGEILGQAKSFVLFIGEKFPAKWYTEQNYLVIIVLGGAGLEFWVL